jgi:diketogulonate reductase-like aldo/keto reductase
MQARRDVQGIALPAFLYGTAWKEQRTEELTRLALAQGFRGIDTANQRKHYFEAAVGDALAAAIADGTVRREDVFLQTKFTSLPGQDHRLPYDADADVATQVRQSARASLEHLRTDVIDSYVLHGPSSRHGVARQDAEAWQAMEALHDAGTVRLLGVSNVSPAQLAAFHRLARVKPAFVQNRCFAASGWDREVRAFCAANGVVYQGFSLLTANARALRSRPVADAAARTGRTAAQVVFRFALAVGMLPLTGTTDAAHMRQDLESPAFDLTPDEIRAIERVEG